MSYTSFQQLRLISLSGFSKIHKNYRIKFYKFGIKKHFFYIKLIFTVGANQGLRGRQGVRQAAGQLDSSENERRRVEDRERVTEKRRHLGRKGFLMGQNLHNLLR